MAIAAFPPVDTADDSGIIAVGGDLEVSSLKLSYSNGIFPWPHEGYPLLWFAPAQRGVLDFDRFHIPKRLQRALKTADFHFTRNQNFPAVIQACSSVPRPGQAGTWIDQAIIAAYIAFHEAGYAQSFEVWDNQQELVGGLYGVRIGKMFCGESMFHRVTNASKYALIQTVQSLQAEGLNWMDTQMVTPLLEQFGAHEIARSEFMKRLQQALEAKY